MLVCTGETIQRSAHSALARYGLAVTLTRTAAAPAQPAILTRGAALTAFQQAATQKDDEDDDERIIMSNKGAVQTCILCCNCVMLYPKQRESKCYVPVGAAQRQTIACSCNIRHFVAEGPADMYGDQFLEFGIQVKPYWNPEFL